MRRLTRAWHRRFPRFVWSALACCIALASVLASSAAAGPWTRAPGRWYFKLAQGLFLADGFRDADGAFVSDTTYRGLTTSAYGEVGLVDGLQAQFYLPFVVGDNAFDRDSILRRTTFCEGGRRALSTQRRTFGDAMLGTQWSSPWIDLPHALRLNAKLPIYDVGEPEGLCRVLFPQPGDGQLDVELWLSAGDSLAGGRFFLFGELGHRLRSEVYFGEDLGQTFADTFLWTGQAGWQFSDGAFFMLNAQLAIPYAADAVSKGGLSLGPAVYLPLGQGFAGELALDFTPWARNAGEGRAERLYWTAATLGVSHKFD